MILLSSIKQEGAFANIILQNGLFGSIGYALTFTLMCPTEGPYCIEYRNGTLHNVLTFELLVCLSAVLAVAGYLRAMSIHWEEQNVRVEDSQLKQYQVDSVTAFRQTRQTRHCIDWIL